MPLKKPMPTRTRSRSPSTAVHVLGVAGLVIWFGGAFLWYQYAGTRPRIPEPQNGRVYALNTHGDFAYLTRAEAARLGTLIGLGFLCGLSAISIHLRVVGRGKVTTQDRQ